MYYAVGTMITVYDYKRVKKTKPEYCLQSDEYSLQSDEYCLQSDI